MHGALAGLLRAVSAVESELVAIRRARPRDGFPHAELCDALPEPGVLTRHVAEFAEEVRTLNEQNAQIAFSTSSVQFAGLHIASQAIRGAVEWSSQFTSIDWWVARRARELGLEAKRVLVTPGSLGQFSIERTSSFREALVDLGMDGRALSGADGSLAPELQPCAAAFGDIHLLRVPPVEGLSPLWHPHILGHEVAHLRYTHREIRTWLANIDGEDPASLQGTAILDAQAHKGDSSREPFGRSPWLTQLERWLEEVACDCVAHWYYGDSAIRALETMLSSRGPQPPSASHPGSDLRLAIQQANGQSDLDELLPGGDPFATGESRATTALVALGLRLREHVHGQMAEVVGSVSTACPTVVEGALTSLADGLLPSSSEWPENDVGKMASAIESALVQAQWRRYDHIEPDLPSQLDILSADLRHTSQAIDGLEFAARFDLRRKALDVEAEERMPLPNVLWLDETGVHIADGQQDGLPSYDVRLGRHFIVFQRSSTAHVDSMRTGEFDAIQRDVEVGWGDTFVLHPGELVLAVTFESVRLSIGCFAQVLSRSSLGRMGLLSATAVHVQPGFRGCLTLELANLSNVPVKLYPGQRIAQIVPSGALGGGTEYAGAFQDSGARPRTAPTGLGWEDEILRTMRIQGL